MMKKSQTTIILRINPDSWKRIPGNYKLVSFCWCPLCGGDGDMAVTIESHDDNPWVSMGSVLCSICGADGGFDMDDCSDYYIGSTGVDAPETIRVNLEYWQEEVDHARLRRTQDKALNVAPVISTKSVH